MEENSLIDAIREYAAELVQNYTAQMPADYQIKDSVTFDVQPSNNEAYSIIIDVPAYWKYIERGRQAGSKMPPIDAIENWIEVKRIVPKEINGKVPTIRQLAFLISRKISRDGIPAKPYLQNAIQTTSKAVITDTMKEYMTKQIKKLLKI